MDIEHTRAMVSAALSGALDHVRYVEHDVFGFAKPQTCPGVPDEVLNPRNTWDDKDAYDAKARELQSMFEAQLAKFA
jgi:phosphoenolpyruvate carboxykinase (ATP)